MSTVPDTHADPSAWRTHPAGPLLERIDLLRVDTARRLDPERQAEMGQFMTPSAVAAFMASLFEAQGSRLHLLDAGAGVGSLTAAWVERVCERKQPPAEIAVTTYELDPAMAQGLRSTLKLCSDFSASAGVRFQGEILEEDFITSAAEALRGGLFGTEPKRFDCAILNPPYRKLHTDSRTRRLLSTLGSETTNLYAAFLALVIRLLRPSGELVAITPRSFCNGPYFRLFRKALIESTALRQIHCFEARDRAFSDDEVLQENVIFHAVKAPERQGKVVVSASYGPDDPCPTRRVVDFSHIVRPGDSDQFIRIPTDALSEAVAERMDQFRNSLSDLSLEVSTGRVVDFRASEFLRAQPADDTVPLIYPAHFSGGYVRWPKRGKKPNALLRHHLTDELTVPRGFYVLVKRFSSKEERRRIVAAVYDPALLPETDVAFENHLNYFHAQGAPLTEQLAKGLAAFLNTTLVDSYFRDWSGHTQVNASDLRRLPYPSRAELEALGRSLGDAFPDQDELDQRIEDAVMPPTKKTADPIRAKKRIKDTVSILKELGLPREQQNVRSALTLLALLDLKPKVPWSEATNPLRGITEMMGFFAEHYGKVYAPNSRETVRRSTVHQFVQAGLAVLNPDNPSRPTNSPQAVYQIEAGALELLRTYGTPEWDKALRTHLSSIETLRVRYARAREMERIPLRLRSGQTVSLTPGGQNVLVKEIIDEFCPRFTPGAKPVYVGDTGEKFAYFDDDALKRLGVSVEVHGKMPDVVVHYDSKGWLVLIEAVTSHGPVNPKRHHELRDLFKGSTAGLVFVTAFLSRRDLTRYLGDIAWETEVWVADAPSHLIHFNGERFLGPS